jgi:crossover junction endodeoxyribonuclease RuvC
MRILGIDPGVATTGWAIVDFSKTINVVDFGVITTSKEHSQQERLFEIYNDLSDIVVKFKPDMAGIELLIFNNNAKTAMNVGEARGIALLLLRQMDIETMQFTPPQIKRSIAGSGRADKKQVQENVKRICNLSTLPTPDDAADAIAIAICCNDCSKLSRMKSNIK